MSHLDGEISATGFEPERRDTVVVTGLASDAHTWNLVFLQLLIEELGYHVVNLGPCVPDEVLVAECRSVDPVMVVIGSVNGHGFQDGKRVIEKLRACAGLADTPTVIGGKLGTGGEHDGERLDALLEAGFDAVFDDGDDSVGRLRNFMAAIPARTAPELSETGTPR
ncbi:cobalamin B12-binding domain-containing protein [Amycolatopsis lurida]